MIPAKYSIMLNDIKDIPIIQDVLNNYTIYDTNYRNTLNNKILNHYAYEEIGFETPALFAHYLKVKLDEIMPKYNKLYESELLKLDPLSNYTIKETLEKEGEQTNTQTGTLSSEGENSSTSSSTNTTSNSQTLTNKENHIFQNTPQGDVKFETIDNYEHATTHNIDGNVETTNGTKNSSISATDNTTTSTENTTSSSGSINTTEEYIKLIIGNRDVSTTKLYNEFINNYISIDKLIIDELQDLFMLIY